MIVTMDGNSNTTKQHKLMRHFFIFDTFAFACASGVAVATRTPYTFFNRTTMRSIRIGATERVSRKRMEMVYVAGDMVECQEATVVD